MCIYVLVYVECSLKICVIEPKDQKPELCELNFILQCYTKYNPSSLMFFTKEVYGLSLSHL
jgi:hypothetical protein